MPHEQICTRVRKVRKREKEAAITDGTNKAQESIGLGENQEMAEKRCTICDINKPKSDYGKSKHGRDGLESECRLCHNARQRKYYTEDRENRCAKRRAIGRQFTASRPLYWILRNARSRAKARGLAFDISDGDFVIPDRCECCNEKIAKHTRHCPSLDRIDNTMGYTLDNTWIICRPCNSRKNDATPAQLMQIARAVIKRLKQNAKAAQTCPDED